MQDSVNALTPALQSAGQAAGTAKTAIANNVLNPLGSLMSKAHNQLVQKVGNQIGGKSYAPPTQDYGSSDTTY